MMKKYVAFSSKHNFHKKVSLFSMLAIVVVSLAIGMLTYFILNRSVHDTIEHNENFNAIQSSSTFMDKLDIIASIANSLASMDSIPSEGFDSLTQLWVRKATNNTLDSYLCNYDYITGISAEISDLLFTSGSIVEDNFTPISKYQGFSISHQSNKDWPYLLQLENTVSIHSKNKTLLQVNCHTLSDFVFNIDKQIRESYIIDENGMILLSNAKDRIFQPLSSFVNYDIQNASVENVRYNNQNYYIYTHRMNEDIPFYYVTLIAESYYNSYTQNAIIKCLLISFLLLSVGLIVVLYIVRYTYKPIRDILDSFKYYSHDVSLYENEIHFIHTQIEKNIQDKHLLSETIEKLHMAQIKTLQAQINPHFLFNTLENIKSLSVKTCGIDNEIEQSLLLLNSILFETIDTKNVLTSIQEERRITELYIKLMQLRYPDCFTVKWDIDPELDHNYMIRFTLQPIIENSILKGFDHTNNGYMITIKFIQETDSLAIVISDNGRGIAFDKLEDIRSQLKNVDASIVHSVGLKNVHLRVQLLFGNDYGIHTIDSSKCGTTVTLKFPLIKGLET